MSYPIINRDGVDFTSDTELCNLGYAEGELSDGRPYRIESFLTYGVEALTIFISIQDLEEKSMNDIKKLLVKEGLIEIIEDNILMDKVIDENEEEFISINVPINDHGKEINKCNIALKEYEVYE